MNSNFLLWLVIQKNFKHGPVPKASLGPDFSRHKWWPVLTRWEPKKGRRETPGGMVKTER